MSGRPEAGSGNTYLGRPGGHDRVFVYMVAAPLDLPMDDPIIKKSSWISNIFHTAMDGIHV